MLMFRGNKAGAELSAGFQRTRSPEGVSETCTDSGAADCNVVNVFLHPCRVIGDCNPNT